MNESNQKNDVIAPMRWIGDRFDDWYYENERNTDIWLEYNMTQTIKKYTQFSIDWDTNGLPVIIIVRKDDGLIVKLTEGKNFQGFNITHVDLEFSFGIWAKKNGKTINKLFLLIFVL